MPRRSSRQMVDGQTPTSFAIAVCVKPSLYRCSIKLRSVPVNGRPFLRCCSYMVTPRAKTAAASLGGRNGSFYFLLCCLVRFCRVPQTLRASCTRPTLACKQEGACGACAAQTPNLYKFGFVFSKMHSARVRGLARLRNLLMSQGGAWDFVPVKLCTSRQSAAVGQTDAGKSSRTLAPFHVAGRARLAVWRWGQ